MNLSDKIKKSAGMALTAAAAICSALLVWFILTRYTNYTPVAKALCSCITGLLLFLSLARFRKVLAGVICTLFLASILANTGFVHWFTANGYFSVTLLQDVAFGKFANFSLPSFLRNKTVIIAPDSVFAFFPEAFAQQVVYDDSLVFSAQHFTGYDLEIPAPTSLLSHIGPGMNTSAGFYMWNNGPHGADTADRLVFFYTENHELYIMSAEQYQLFLEENYAL